MRVIKKDFVNENTISFCGKGRRLSSGKAYFIQNPNGDIIYGGKQCAEENSTTDLTQIPDFTKSLITRREGSQNNGNKTNHDTNRNDLNKTKALTYMLFREERLPLFKYASKSLSYEPLQEYYESYKETYDLSEDAIRHILNIEKKLSKSKIPLRRLSLRNLHTCCAYEYILERTLDCLEKKNNKDGVEYTKGLMDWLHNKCHLTVGQIDGLSKWLQYLPKDLAEAKLENFDYNE